MFDDENADFILRATGSRPQTDFRVHRAIIAVASPPLATMLALPQPPPPPDTSTSLSPKTTSTVEKTTPTVEKTIPTVEVSETASVLQTLLQLIYPIADSPTPDTFRTIDELISVLEAAYKYDVDAAIVRLKIILISPKWLESSPLRVYAVTMRWDMEEEAKIASTHTLRESLGGIPLLNDFRHTSGLAFQRLASLHWSRSMAAQALVDNAGINSTTPCTSCGISIGSVRWFMEWKVKAKEELALRPTTHVVFSLQFLGPIWAVTANPHSSCPNTLCERNKIWSPALGTCFNTLKEKIDALSSTI